MTQISAYWIPRGLHLCRQLHRTTMAGHGGHQCFYSPGQEPSLRTPLYEVSLGSGYFPCETPPFTSSAHTPRRPLPGPWPRQGYLPGSCLNIPFVTFSLQVLYTAGKPQPTNRACLLSFLEAFAADWGMVYKGGMPIRAGARQPQSVSLMGVVHIGFERRYERDPCPEAHRNGSTFISALRA